MGGAEADADTAKAARTCQGIFFEMGGQLQCRLFVRLFSRRPYGTHSGLEWVTDSGHNGSYRVSDILVVEEDKVTVGLAAVKQSAATMLRSVMLYRACMVAQGSVCARLNMMRGYF